MTAAARIGAALAGAALAVAGVAAAASVRVNDSGTVVSAPVVNMRWRQLVPGRGADHTVEAQLRVAVRLDLAAWVNRPVRLYMVLAPISGENVAANWRTQGRLLAGSLRSGARAQVFEGRVPAAVLEDTIDLTLATDGRVLASPQTLQFTFELDTP